MEITINLYDALLVIELIASLFFIFTLGFRKKFWCKISSLICEIIVLFINIFQISQLSSRMPKTGDYFLTVFWVLGLSLEAFFYKVKR